MSIVVEEVVRELDAIVAADGGRLLLRSATPERVELALDLTDSSCAECVLSRSMLVDIVRRKLAAVAPDIREVELHDPREVDGSGPG